MYPPIGECAWQNVMSLTAILFLTRFVGISQSVSDKRYES